MEGNIFKDSQGTDVDLTDGPYSDCDDTST